MAKIRSSYVVTGDLTRAVAFYERVLGERAALRDGDRWAEFRLEGARFALSSPGEAARGAVGSTVVFEVDDLSAAKSAVVAAGGAVLEERDMGGHGKTATFRDPDGHLGQLFVRAR